MSTSATTTAARRPRAILGALVVSVAIGACAAGGTAPQASDAPESVRDALEQALSQRGVSAQQIEILEQAVAEGRNMTDAEYRGAYGAAIECVEESGVSIIAIDEYWNAGILQLSVSYRSSLEDADAGAAAIGECERVHVAYIAAARNSKQSIRAAQDAVIARYLPALRDCLREHGYRVAEDAAYDEVAHIDAAAEQEDGTPTGCWESTGFNDAMTGPPE